jgi:hypothetical protein
MPLLRSSGRRGNDAGVVDDMIYANDDSTGGARGPSPLGEEIRRRARRGAVIVGVSVFAAMLAIAIIMRVSHFRVFRWDAIGLVSRFDLMIVLVAALAGAVVGAVTGAILAIVSRPSKESREPEKHPLD